MPNAFNKEERVAFDDVLAGFQDALVLSKMVNVYRTDQQMMERTGDVIWRPQPYIGVSFDGSDQTANFTDYVQLAVPSTIGFQKSVPFALTANELRDQLQEGRLGEAAKQKLASDINVSINNTASFGGTLVVKRSAAATGFDDVAQCEAIMNEQGVMMDQRYIGLSTRDYNGMASNLASRTLDNSKSLTAYDRAFIGRVASFDAFKMDYTPRLAAAAGVGVTVTGANQFYTPAATATGTTGTNNVDNRFQNLAITVTSGTVKVGDSFTIAGVNAVHHITKGDTGQLKTFRITAIVTGGGGTGTVQISPPIISAQGASAAEREYQNVTATPAAAAQIVFLNTASAFLNPFFHKDAMEILPGRIAVADSGIDVMRGTTDQGFEMVMTKQTDINTHRTKYRFDVRWGTVMLQPEMAGIIMFS